MREPWTIRILRKLLWGFFRLFCRLEFHGQENIPEKGPCIVTPNHQTYFDPFMVSLGMKTLARYMAWDRLFRLPLLGRLIRNLGAFPVNLLHPDISSYKQSLEVLSGGGFLMVFPEGKLSKQGILDELKPGVARLALATGATLLPCTITGGERVWPKSRILPLPGKMHVVYHAPIPVVAENFNNPEEEKSRVAEILTHLHNSISENM